MRLKVPFLQLEWDGKEQPEAGESWSGYSLTFTGDSCSSELLSYGQNGEFGVGPAPLYTGPSTNMTNIMSVATS